MSSYLRIMWDCTIGSPALTAVAQHPKWHISCMTLQMTPSALLQKGVRASYTYRAPLLPLLHRPALARCSLRIDRLGAGRKNTILGHATFVKVESSSKRSLPVRRSSLLRTFKDILSIMPSYLRSSHRPYSFPPWIAAADDDQHQMNDLPDIDENPFAHFISPITDADDPYELSLSAGIDVYEGPHTTKASKFKSNVADKWARYVRHNHGQLHTQYHAPTIYEEDEDDESFMSLDDDRLNDTPHMVTQISTPKISMRDPTRGRAQDLVARKQQNRRRQSRTLSGHRHSWREPSPDLFTVDESEEEETPTLRYARARKAKDGAERRRSSRSRARFDVAEKSRL
ncbi:hypothetical protein EJ02DRAFT_509308 [Clathrospora elynae]|uniref:Uncharacterized protein n=1 Tax=Clathrospora elynae TaxID=706981 RepID=A0A6A5SZB2_9PLEO|nr:hypothetical protein EJ02DRAFT_509308 [Clathrospora elynae]